jgi:hypothetical protein
MMKLAQGAERCLFDTQNMLAKHISILVWRYPQNCPPSEIFDFWPRVKNPHDRNPHDTQSYAY